MTARHTPDERFMIMAYQKAMEAGGLNTPLDKFEIGKLVGLHEKAANTICKTLMQTNFIKKAGDGNYFTITANGEQLVLRLLEE